MKPVRTLSIVALLVFAPLTFSKDEGLKANDACAFAGDCCAEAGSTCVNNGAVTKDAYYSSKGCNVNET